MHVCIFMHLHVLNYGVKKKKVSEIVPMFLPRQPGGQCYRSPDSTKAVSKTSVQRAHVGECCPWRSGGQFLARSMNKQDRGAQKICA